MKPNAAALRLMSAVRATAKMHEYRVPREDHVSLPRDPSALFAQAIGILGDASAAIADNFIDPKYETDYPLTWDRDGESIASMVRFSATFFDAYLEAQLDVEITSEFSLLCAAAYYLSENVGSASVVAKRSKPPQLDLGHGLARIAFNLLLNDFRAPDHNFKHKEFAIKLFSALGTYFDADSPINEARDLCKHLRKQTYENGSARELLYSDIIAAICSRKFDNSSRRIIPPASGLPPDAWRDIFRRKILPIELWPAQRKICDAGLLSGKSAVIQMPTSAGKTRATEMIIRSHFLNRRSKLAVIVAPFRSLCHDIRSDLSKAFLDDDIVLDEVSDSLTLDVDLDDLLSHKSVLVVTPEKMLYMLRRAPEFAEKIGLAVYDEGHQFEGMKRGPTYELLLASLKISLPKTAQVILISAVIGNASQIADWLLGDSTAVIEGKNLLPATKNIAFASWQQERGWLQYVSPTDPDEVEFFVPRVIDTLRLAKRSNREKDRVFPERGTSNDYSESYEVGLYLGLHLVANGSVALFCGQKGSVTKLCRRVVDIFERKVGLRIPRELSDMDEIKKIASLISAQLGATSEATQAAALGVLAHHSNTPNGVRLSIEHAMKEGRARFVVCTSTLAQGVNFPIKYLIVSATQQGAERIKVRDFHNLMGRAGRAGMHTEASVIFSAPNLYDERHTSSGYWRWQQTKKLLDSSNSERKRCLGGTFRQAV